MYSFVTHCNCIRGNTDCLKRVDYKNGNKKCPSGFNVDDVNFSRKICYGRRWLKFGVMSAPRREMI